MLNRKVVVTGMGVVSPAGTGVTAFGKALREGKSGEGDIRSFDASGFPVKRAFEVKGFEPRRYGTHFLDPFIQYAVAAADEAVTMAGFDAAQADPFRVGMSVSSSKGGMHTLSRFKDRFEKNPSAILGARIYTNAVPNFAAQWIARRWKLKGPAKCYVAACATGTMAVMEGARMVREGVVDYCLAGASDASVVPLMLAAYRNMKALSPDGIRPFDKRRNGFMVGEGGAILFLETAESAKARRAKVFGEIKGWSTGHDASDPLLFDPKEEALARALKDLLKRSDLKAGNIGYVNLHGTGTPHGDVYETGQIKKAFGKTAGKIPMSSIKPMTGHMLGGSGAVEIVASLIAMRDGFIPPTLNLEQPDPACDLDYTPLRAKEAKLNTAVSLSMGFGGQIAAIALAKA